MHLSTAKFMLLYSWYSWPNVILCFFGGFLIDRVFGIRWGSIIFSFIICIGQVVFALGALLNAFWLMQLGRFIFGIGGESLAVAQNTYAVSWFKGKELNLVFGLQLSMARIGSTVNLNVMGWLYHRIATLIGSPGHTTLGVTLMIGGVTCVFSLLCGLILAFMDWRAEKILHKEQGKTGEVIKIRDMKDFSLSLWIIFLICVWYYVAIFPFIGLGKLFFIEKYKLSPQTASAINSIVYVISAPLSPAFGFLVDKTGRNVLWVLFAVVATLASHSMLAFTFWNPWIAMCLLGISYSLLACALWPMVAYIIPEHQLGTAYGFMQSIQNLGLAIISIVAGEILDHWGYLYLEIFFIACVSVSLLSVVLLYLVDCTRGGTLNCSVKQREDLSKSTHAE
ncbi:major facilitator superfamily domain-containing protein 1 [Gracilinanus agilis]|uniref:major facilitator superfamily domain-containing protein 1 n=1 Tax=Gracilinanus agilis TaxID=191870 RepID=UPI001CFC8851|nr:major facilitator superfamily domain-containing protein 1 [Gracilinanus agilis]